MAPTIRVFTFKDGLLARLAHDLQLTLQRFEVVRDGAAVTGQFWPESLIVDGAVDRRGQLDTHGLSAADRAKIHTNMTRDVLQLARFPEVTFTGQVTGPEVQGTLQMHGAQVSITAACRVVGTRVHCECTLVPSRWGIAPYKALAGAIKLQDRIVVRLDFPADPGDPTATTVPTACRWQGEPH